MIRRRNFEAKQWGSRRETKSPLRHTVPQRAYIAFRGQWSEAMTLPRVHARSPSSYPYRRPGKLPGSTETPIAFPAPCQEKDASGDRGALALPLPTSVIPKFRSCVPDTTTRESRWRRDGKGPPGARAPQAEGDPLSAARRRPGSKGMSETAPRRVTDRGYVARQNRLCWACSPGDLSRWAAVARRSACPRRGGRRWLSSWSHAAGPPPPPGPRRTRPRPSEVRDVAAFVACRSIVKRCPVRISILRILLQPQTTCTSRCSNR